MIAPVASRELLVSSRRPASWRIRLVTTVCALVVAFFALTDTPSVSAAGQVLFHGLGIVALLYTLCAGFIYTSGSITDERREGTFGLLYLTPLKSWEVIIGKLASTSLQAIYGLLAIIPVMALSLLAGGVTGQQLIRMALTLVATLFLSLAAGMFASAGAQSRRGAFGMTLMLVAAPVAGGWIGVMVTSVLAYVSEREKKRSANAIWYTGFSSLVVLLILSAQMTDQGLLGSPVHVYAAVWDMGVSVATFNVLIGALLAIALFYLFSASLCTEWYRAAREIVIEAEENEHAVDDLFFPGIRQRGPVANDPAYWLLTFLQTQPMTFYVLLAIMIMFNLVSGSAPIGGGINFFFSIVSWLPYVAMNFVLAKICAAPFHVLHRSGFMETLLTTPLRNEDLVRAQRTIYWKMLHLPLLFMVLASIPLGMMFLYSMFTDSSYQSNALAVIFFCSHWLLGWTVFALQLETLASVAMLNASDRRTPMQAALRSIAIVVVPGLVFMTIAPIILRTFINRGQEMNHHLLLMCVIDVMLGSYLFWLLRRSREQLGLSMSLLRP